jgi:hypothetical protein
MEPAVPHTQRVEAEPGGDSDPGHSEESAPGGDASNVAQVPAEAAASETFYLEHVTSDQIFTIRQGVVMGQAHETSHAEVQIPAELDGSEYLHRRHCRFDRQQDKWFVVPLDQSGSDQEFVNPTYVNKRQVTPGEHQVLNDGDILRLAGVSFYVRFIR